MKRDSILSATTVSRYTDRKHTDNYTDPEYGICHPRLQKNVPFQARLIRLDTAETDRVFKTRKTTLMIVTHIHDKDSYILTFVHDTFTSTPLLVQSSLYNTTSRL